MELASFLEFGSLAGKKERRTVGGSGRVEESREPGLLFGPVACGWLTNGPKFTHAL
jgi:hypothetical protein